MLRVWPLWSEQDGEQRQAWSSSSSLGRLSAEQSGRIQFGGPRIFWKELSGALLTSLPVYKMWVLP